MKEAIHGNFKHGELKHGEKAITTHIPEVKPKPIIKPDVKRLSFWRATLRLIKALFCVLYYFIKEKIFNIKPK